MNKIKHTDAIKALEKAYWDKHHMWQVVRSDILATWRDQLEVTSDIKVAFEELVAEIMKQHRRQHGNAPKKAEVVACVNEWIGDEINRMYRAAKKR
jgi:hypothetical protein